MKKTKTSQRQFFVRVNIISLLVFAFFAATVFETGFAASNAQAQQSITGEWLIDFNRKNPNEVYLSITRGNPISGSGTRSSNNVSISEIQGISRDQAFAGQKDAKFRIVREAGTFEMEGSFREGKGAGFWTLVPNQNFISAMQSSGYSLSPDKDVFDAALFDISIKFIEDLKAAGYDRLTVKDLVRARIFKIDAQFVKEVQEMGFERQPFETLVDMRIAKITPQFISKMRSAGFENLTIKELKDLGIHRVTPEFINEVKAEGFASVSPRQAVELKIHRVDGDFIRRVKAKGFTDVTLKQLVNLRIHDIVK
jgi:hypothetical protein